MPRIQSHATAQAAATASLVKRHPLDDGSVEAEIAALDWHGQGQPVAIGLAAPKPFRSAGQFVEHYQRER